MKRLLILEDGSVYEGTAFGADHFQYSLFSKIVKPMHFICGAFSF